MPCSRGLLQWVSALKETGKLEQSWSFAGLKGGGAILNVDSLEELDSIMGGFPLSPVTEIQVYGLADLENGVNGVLSALRRGGRLGQVERQRQPGVGSRA